MRTSPAHDDRAVAAVDLGLSRILLGVCGSAAAAHAPALASALATFSGAEVTPVLTRAALGFTTARALELNTHSTVYTDDEDHRGVAHLELTRWAELILVLPATANVLSLAAAGAAPDLLTTCLVAASSPVVFAPSMNEVMWRKPAVQRNVRVLQEDGHGVIPPGQGPAAVDGRVGYGALQPIPRTLDWLRAWLAPAGSHPSSCAAAHASGHAVVEPAKSAEVPRCPGT